MNRKMLYIIMIMLGCGYWAQTGFGYDSNGNRDPFVSLIEKDKVEHVRPSGIEGIASINDVILEGIAVSPTGKNAAILNGEMVKEKDKVGILQIKKISKNTVELSIDGKDYTLSLQAEEGTKIGK